MTPCRPISRRGRFPRTGMVLVAGMIALLVATMIGGNLLRTVVRHHRAVAEAERRLQTEWLVEAGLERGAARRIRDANYPGEAWTLVAADLALETNDESNADDAVVARIEIRITPGDDGETFTVAARAEYPWDTPGRVATERRIDVTSPRQENDE